MTHHYQLKGLTCSSCIAQVKHALLLMPDVLSAEVTMHSAVITMDRHIPTEQLQAAIGHNGKYSITPDAHHGMDAQPTVDEKTGTYKPLLLVAAFVTGVSFLSSFGHHGFDAMMWMNYFMAGFFIAFSFFKFLDLRAFADSYAMYDIVARKSRAYGFIYPFLELGLGIAFLMQWQPLLTNAGTVLLLGISSIGVIKSVLNKQQIKCACLGTVFNLPMSTVTIIENAIMITMAVLSLFFLL